MLPILSIGRAYHLRRAAVSHSFAGPPDLAHSTVSACASSTRFPHGAQNMSTPQYPARGFPSLYSFSSPSLPPFETYSDSLRYWMSQSSSFPSPPFTASRACSSVCSSAARMSPASRASYAGFPPSVAFSSRVQGTGVSARRIGSRKRRHQLPDSWLLPWDPNVYARFTSGMRHERPFRIGGSRMASSQNASGQERSRSISSQTRRGSIHPSPGKTSVLRRPRTSLTSGRMPLSFHALAQ
mmetsp:Transcript_19699/g.48160  ORF Transcript_19699/g.48160 Transcript_19699/m.48160 type:complete len:240 (-) Transcript_19699:798-1517(-)